MLMKYLQRPVLFGFVLSIFSLHVSADELSHEAVLKAEAVKIVKTFGGMLKPRLQEAIQTGGLAHAINVCSVEAPNIAEKLSKETGWQVKRVSLKPRNKSSAVPDDFEKKILEQFNAQQSKGEAPAAVEHAEILNQQFRYMKAQVVEGLCLNCHGSSLSPEVIKALGKHYPKDVATGYSLGEIRGAFSLVKGSLTE
ncbi:MAG: DUF3365 domain-containing protein [Pseudomonadota bacterium]